MSGRMPVVANLVITDEDVTIAMSATEKAEAAVWSST